MATWDVFHSDRLEVERGLSTLEVQKALACGELRDDDLIRPSGTSSPWTSLADMPAVHASEPSRSTISPEFEQAIEDSDVSAEDEDELELEFIEEEEPVVGPLEVAEHHVLDLPQTGLEEPPYSEFDLRFRDRAKAESEPRESSVELGQWENELEEKFDPLDEDEAAAEFTLARGKVDKVEELDLAAMVDVAFQLVLFFLVTATTILYKSLEVPKPNPENNPAAAAQGKSKSLDDLKNAFILVEIDPTGAVKIDNEPVAAEMSALVERLRSAREQSHRESMLLSADFSTPHRSAVLAYDAANEIGLGIAIARPVQPVGAPPVVPPARLTPAPTPPPSAPGS